MLTRPEITPRGDVYRSKAIGCQRAARLVLRSDTRELLMKLACQWHDIADQLDRLDLLTASRPE